MHKNELYVYFVDLMQMLKSCANEIAMICTIMAVLFAARGLLIVMKNVGLVPRIAYIV